MKRVQPPKLAAHCQSPQRGGDDRDGEAPAEPLKDLTHIDLAARREPRPPVTMNTRFLLWHTTTRSNASSHRETEVRPVLIATNYLSSAVGSGLGIASGFSAEYD